MRKYETPLIEIMMLETAENVMVGGKLSVQGLHKEDNVNLGGDEYEEANKFNSKLWDNPDQDSEQQ